MSCCHVELLCHVVFSMLFLFMFCFTHLLLFCPSDFMVSDLQVGVNVSVSFLECSVSELALYSLETSPISPWTGEVSVQPGFASFLACSQPWRDYCVCGGGGLFVFLKSFRLALLFEVSLLAHRLLIVSQLGKWGAAGLRDFLYVQ